jgi:DNA-binding response OmpR family regulator
MTADAASTLKVLVADDEPAMLNLVARHVRGMGFAVIEASEGDAAWDLAQEYTPDLVILDVMMPGMSGWEVCRRLKGSPNRQFEETGVIMLTGIGENLNDITSPLFAADAWLNKPFDFNELDCKIRETLEHYEKTSAKSGGAKKAPAKKAPAKKAPAKKAPVKKAPAKKAPAKKAPAKKAPAKGR